MPEETGASPTPVTPRRHHVAVESRESGDEIDLRELWRALVRQRWIVLLTVLVLTGVTGIYALLATPVYRAEVIMVPAGGEDRTTLAGLSGQLGGLASLAGIDLAGSDSEVEVSVATLRSREFTDAFISDHQLLPVLFCREWDAQAGVWRVDDPKDIPSPWDAYRLFDRKVRAIHQDKKTGLVTLRIHWKDRVLAARWANELVQRVNRYRQQEAIEEAERSIAYLHEQLKKTHVVELQQAIYRLIEAQTKKIMLANVREQYAFKVIDAAVAPDEDDYVKPNRPLVLGLGFVGGLLLGVMAALVRDRSGVPEGAVASGTVDAGSA
jgi:uncharacterized protein involved in exopolysaccharide biosynthesis